MVAGGAGTPGNSKREAGSTIGYNDSGGAISGIAGGYIGSAEVISSGEQRLPPR